jgi:hypothetical protein
VDVQELARAHTEAAIQTLVECLRDPRLRVQAAALLLDRAWGKASQVIAGDEDKPVAIDFTWAPALPPAVAAEDGSGSSAQSDALTLEWETTC